jgi:hypothetical protein
MYEFVKTPTGWRVFWGIDPLGQTPEKDLQARQEAAPEEPDVLPFRRPQPPPVDRPAG